MCKRTINIKNFTLHTIFFDLFASPPLKQNPNYATAKICQRFLKDCRKSIQSSLKIFKDFLRFLMISIDCNRFIVYPIFPFSTFLLNDSEMGRVIFTWNFFRNHFLPAIIPCSIFSWGNFVSIKFFSEYIFPKNV